MQDKSSHRARAPGVMLFDVAAIVLAFPLASAAYERIVDLPWVTSANTLVSVIVLALVVWILGSWMQQLYATRERSVLRAVVRSVRAFTIAGVLFAVVFAILASATRLQALSPLLLELHLAFALALLVGARLGWRTLVMGAAHDRPPLHEAARSRLDAMSPAGPQELRGGFAPPAVLAAPERANAREGELLERSGRTFEGPGGALLDRGPGPVVGTANGVLDVLRTCMDEVSYTPGSPNVLSMTKYLHEERVGRRKYPRRYGALAARLEGAPAARCVRTDRGDETVLEIAGVLDAVRVADVRPAIEGLIAEQRKSVTVDLSALQRIDSAGVGLIVSVFKRCSTFGGCVRVSGVKDQPLAIFRMLRLDRIFALQ